MNKIKLRTGDVVRVLAGDHKGSEGKILKITKDKSKVIVEGVNMVKKHNKPSAQNPQGGIIEKEAAMHISNLSLISKDGAATRVGYRMEKDKKVRYAKKTNDLI